MRLRTSGWGCLLAALLPACQCQEARRGAAEVALSPSALSAPSLASGAASLAQRVCAVLQREPAERRAQCCGRGVERHLAAECEGALRPALERASLSIDSAALEACARASAEQQQGCGWVTPGQPLPPAECQGLTLGALAVGASCRSSLECQSPLHCAGSTPSEPGHCAAPAEGGSPCGASSDALAALLLRGGVEQDHPSCSGNCSLLTHRCEAQAAPPATAREAVRAQSGEACQSDFDCARGGCSGGQCGMKCSVALAPPPAQVPALAFRRRAAQ